jgi:hypothetical protein
MTGIAQSLAQRFETCCSDSCRIGFQKPDPNDFPALLCVKGDGGSDRKQNADNPKKNLGHF